MAGVQAEGRYRFLEAVGRRVPAVLDDLALPGAESTDALRAWGERWNLSDPWCLSTALLTLQAWRDTGGKARGEWEHPPADYVLPDGYLPSHGETLAGLTFRHPGWEPTATFYTRPEARAAILRAFTAQLDDYLEMMEQRAREAGLVPTPETRTPEHFDWLAAHQVQGLSLSEVAREACRSRQAVSQAVAGAAELIELTLRPASKPGRPRKA